MTKELMKDILTILCCWTVIITCVLVLEGTGHDLAKMSGNVMRLIINGSI